MSNHYQPYKIFEKGPLRIGVTGVGIELEGLVPAALYGNTQYLDPVVHANTVADELKKKHKCDLVICLSHLGDRYTENKISDETFAKASSNIDLIIGGHTHRFFEKPREYNNSEGKKVIVNQVGWGGLQLGRLDYVFSTGGAKILDKNQSFLVV